MSGNGSRNNSDPNNLTLRIPNDTNRTSSSTTSLSPSISRNSSFGSPPSSFHAQAMRTAGTSSSASAGASTGAGGASGSSVGIVPGAQPTERERERRGGMAQPSGERSGAKTPRKNVQWAASTKGEGPMPLLLDEEGLDPKAFQTLAQALEKHRSQEQLSHVSGGNGPAIVPVNTSAASGAPASSGPPHSNAHAHFLSEDPAGTVVGVGGAANSKRPNSRPRLSLANLPPNPFQPRSNEEGGDTQPSAMSSRPTSPVPTDSSRANSDLSNEGSPTKSQSQLSLQGEAFIESGERHGLPAPLPTDARDKQRPEEMDLAALEEQERKRIEARASKLVRAHRSGFQVIQGFRGNGPWGGAAIAERDRENEAKRKSEARASARKSSAQSHSYNPFRRFSHANKDKDEEDLDEKASAEEEEDLEAPPPPSMNRPLGGGVLSALLTLYNDRPPTTSSHGYSLSNDSTLLGSEPTTPEPEPHKRRSFERFGRRRGSLRAEKERERQLEAYNRDEHTDYFGKAATANLPSLSRQSTQNSYSSAPSSGYTSPRRPGESSTAGRSLHAFKSQKVEPLVDKVVSALGGERALPAQARNGGGVFGTLIASTGNITGVAAPIQSRIGPNVKRPGYHLSRYSEEAEPEPYKRKKANNSNGSSAGGSGSSSPYGLGTTANASVPGLLGLAGLGIATDATIGVRYAGAGSKSAPATPAGELGPSAGSSPASSTPLIIYTHDNDKKRFSHTRNAKSLDNGLMSPGAETPGSVSGYGHSRAHSDGLSLTTVPTRSTVGGKDYGSGGKKKWAGILKDIGSSAVTLGGLVTPDEKHEQQNDYFDERKRRAEERRRKKRKKAEIYITRHVAEIIQRQEFIMKLARAFMMFGAPSHRLPAQIQATAHVLDIQLACMYLPDVMLISFDDAATSTSNIKFIRQGAALTLGKLQDAYDLYWRVIHDEVGVGEASRSLDALMQARPPYPTWLIAAFGGFCSSSICVTSFNGSFIDALISFPLGCMLVVVQVLSVRNELYSNIFEITIATLLSFLAAVFAGTHHFCYSAVASGSIVLILPGFLVLNGSLELSARNIVSGAVRLCYAVMYSIFLGFGLSIGGTLYESITGEGVVNPEDYTCSASHDINGPWYQKTPSTYWYFLAVPMYSLFLTLRNYAPWKRKELIISVVIACIGWTCNHFSALAFPNRNDVSSAIGAFSVGFVSNLYGRFFSGNAFVIMITGILFQLPSGLGNGGLITFASQNNSSGTSTSYLSGFETALQLISVSVGLTVGLGISLVLIFPIQSRKRAGGVFSL